MKLKRLIPTELKLIIANSDYKKIQAVENLVPYTCENSGCTNQAMEIQGKNK